MNMTAKIPHVNKALSGAAIGAGIALVWIIFDTSAALLLLTLSALGALIGLALDRPERIIGVLERLTKT